MSEHTTLPDDYERLYSAAARMLWAQRHPSWREEGSEWPEDRRLAWQALERVLLASDASLGEPRPGELSDPSRHLISRRAPGDSDRPLSFAEAVEDWRRRLAADPGYLVEREEPYPDYYMKPGACVVVPHSRHLALIAIFHELFHRVAPGRPGIVLGQDAADLSAVSHEAADALRAALGSAVPTPHPATAPWVEPTPHRVADVPDLVQKFEELRRAAWPAAETVPSPEEVIETADFSIELSAARAASDVLQMLAGRPAPAWREEYEEIDPSRHRVVGLVSGEAGPRPTSFGEEANSWRSLFAEGSAPWSPQDYQRQFHPDRGEDDVVLSATRALVFAELLDEYAARHVPGRRSGLIHYGAYEFGQFVLWEFGRELRAHVGF
ncbi:hypothetical protein AB0K09_02490 [Streptomyces sp. NPDC049577]|uniref:hypothetical protein n=1 Tax=Streptomyces sp. NPDC049577 TaxID=3155153 RepID=UPI0034308474